MSNVVDIFGNQQGSNLTYLLCPCTEEGTPFAVAVEFPIVDGDPLTIAHLRCPTCSDLIEVVNGVIPAEED